MLTCASLYLGSLVVRIKVFLLKEVITLFRRCHVQDMPPSSNKRYMTDRIFHRWHSLPLFFLHPCLKTLISLLRYSVYEPELQYLLVNFVYNAKTVYKIQRTLYKYANIWFRQTYIFQIPNI